MVVLVLIIRDDVGNVAGDGVVIDDVGVVNGVVGGQD